MKPKSTLRSFLALASSSLLAISYSHATTYTWDNSNVTGAATLDWFTGGSNPLGLWTGSVVPVSSNTNTIQFFANMTTNLTHAGNPTSQTVNINNSGSAFELGTLTLSGKGSTTANAKLNLTISGDALNFSALTGTINLDAINQSGTQTITYNLNSNIQLGTASSAGALTLTGNGTGAFNIGGIISELQLGGGSLIKSGTSTVSLTGANSYTGTTTLNGGTLILSGLNGSIASSTGITFNGGNLTLTNATGQSGVDRVGSDAITSNGGTITWTNPSADNTADWAETLGTLSLTTGQTNIVSTNAVNVARTQVLTLGAGSLTHAASDTSAITFSGASLGTGTVNNIVITSLGNTAANEIIGPWATYGTSAAAQTDYATYNITGGVTNSFGIQGAGIIASAQSAPWSTDYTIGTGTLNNTLANASGSALNGRLTATRNINTLRNTTAAGGAISVDIPSNYVTLAGNTFADGDVVVLGTTAGGLTAGVPYYVRDYNGDTLNGFKLAATSGGTAIDITAANTSTITGGITLSTGNNLGTYGILNGSTAVLAIGRSGTGVVTLPSTTSGKLYVTAGAGAINIAAPITDNGAGVLALVKSGNNTLTLSGANTYTGATTINAGTLQIDSAGSLGSGNYAGNISIASNAVLNFGNPTQTLGGNIDIGNNGTLNFTGSSNQIAVAYVVNGAISGSGSVNFNTLMNNAGGTLTLNGNNTYTGKTSFGPGNIISTLTLSVSSFDYITSGSYANHGLGSSLGAPTTVANGTILIGVVSPAGTSSANAVLNYTGPGETTDRVLSFAFGQASSARRIDASGSGLLKFTSPFTHTSGGAGAITLQGNGLGEVAGGIADLYVGLPVTKTGTGTWTLSANNTYTGATTISGGILSLGSAENANVSGPLGKQLATAAGTILMTGSGTLRYSAVNQFDYSGRFSIGGAQTWVIDTNNQAVTFGTILQGASTLTKTGLGTLTLSVANSYTGATSVNGGILELKSGASTLTQTLGALAFAGGDGTIESNKSGAGNITTNFNAFTTRVAGNTGNIKSTGGTNGTDNTVNITGTAGFIDKGVFFGGSEFAARSATNGFVRALNYLTTGGDTNTVNVGAITASKHVKLISTPGTQAAISLLSLNLSGSGVSWTTTSGSLTVPGIIKSGGGSQSTISGGSLTTASNAELVIRTDTSSDSLAISSNLTQGSGALTKSGAGKLTLSGTASTYTGQTYVNGGTLSIGANINIGAQATGATLNLRGGTLQATGTFGLFNVNAGTNNRAVVLTDSSGFDVTSSNTLTVAGVVSGTGSLTKSNTGTLALTNTNTYSGGTTISNSGGVLQITTATALGLGDVSILTQSTNTGTLELALTGTNSITKNFTTSSASTLTTVGANAHILNTSGTNTISGNITVTGGGGNGTNIVSNGGLLTLAGTITSTTGSNRTLSLGGSGNGVVSGAINNESGFIFAVQKSGAGTWTLSNASNTYNGATTVSQGTLRINGSTSASSAVSVASGAALGGDGTVGGNATFSNGSIFAWNLSVTTPANTGSATVADTMAVTGNLVDGNAAGGSVFKILLGGTQTFADNFWTANQSWSNVLTSGNSLALETLFTSFSYENAGGVIAGPTGGFSFTLSGSTLSYSAVPEPTSALVGLLVGAGLLRRRRNVEC